MKELEKKSLYQLSLTVLSGICGDMGSSIFSFGLGFMLLDKTGSVFSFTISNIVSPILGFVLLPIIGPIIDTLSKKKIIIISQTITVVSLILYWILLPNFGDNLLAPTTILIIILKGSDQFTFTARQASCIGIVLSKDVQKLNSYTQMSTSVANIASSILGASLYALLPFELFIICEIVTEVITVIITLMLNFTLNPENESDFSIIKNGFEENDFNLFRDGLFYIKKQKYLLFGMTIATSINFLSGIFSVGIPILFLQVFNLNNFHFGIAEAFNAIGFLVGGILMQRKLTIKYPILNLWKTTIIIGITLIFIGVFIFIGGKIGILVIYVLLFIIGFLFVILNVPYTVWVQKNISLFMQGRVLSILSSLGMATSPLGVLFYGFIFEMVRNIPLLVALTFSLSGILMIVLHCILLKRSRLDLKNALIFRMLF